MKRLWILLLFGLAACSAASSSDLHPDSAMLPSSLPDLGPAPEFVNDVWLNVEAPLRLADLRGKVTLVDMWTFG
jgi:hypothetical protein